MSTPEDKAKIENAYTSPTLVIDNKIIGELPHNGNATMDDNGGEYFTWVESSELNDCNDPIKYKVVWTTLEAWDNEELNKDDESVACDWEKFEVFDESGNQIASSK